ncbi:helix-turn-helix domain-containing protein [Maribacter sp. 2304DJ31-5]|uniref:helix-turn-helix domain-containing protein n=1 Tax=Maribacter sp. 2304DJ31-5 TaxID=3386273 RepID=UPI0039BD2961
MIKERLKKLRLAHNLTQTTPGKISGVSNVQIGRYENGVSKPKPETLIKLAKALGVNPGYFTDKKQIPRQYPSGRTPGKIEKGHQNR